MVALVFALGVGLCLFTVVALLVFGYLLFEAISSVIRGHGDDYNDLEFGDDEEDLDSWLEGTRTTRKTSDSELKPLLGTIYPRDAEDEGKN